MIPSQEPPSTVNVVRPSDVGLLSTIGLHMRSTELSSVVSRLRELMVLFNPEPISHLSEETNLYAPQLLQHSTLMEQVKEVSLYLQNSQREKHLTESEALQHKDKLLVQMWTNLERPYLKAEGNSPSHHHRNISPLLEPFTGTEKPCEDLSPSPSTPTLVHKLRPGDIKVVAAVGDSLTAGKGIAARPSDILDVLRQYRGLSWSICGDENLTSITTLPNMLKYFRQNLTGYSVGQQDTPQAFLNQAVAGAKSHDVPTQVRALVERMKNDSRINFESDWKVITFFIGGNDLCEHCYNSQRYSTENYVCNVRKSLDYLHKEVPRALVNLVEPLQITQLREMHKGPSLECPTWLVKIMCPCVIWPKSKSEALQMLEDLNRSYQRALHELVDSGRYDTRSDFTALLQPFFRDIIFSRLPLKIHQPAPLKDGRPDRAFFSADCFHVSQKAQIMTARSLWNNMINIWQTKGTPFVKHLF